MCIQLYPSLLRLSPDATRYANPSMASSSWPDNTRMFKPIQLIVFTRVRAGCLSWTVETQECLDTLRHPPGGKGQGLFFIRGQVEGHDFFDPVSAEKDRDP